MDTSRLAKRLKKIQDRTGGGKNIWFKSTEEKQKIRQVPYPHDVDGDPFFEVYFHYNIAGNRSLVCPKETHGEPCPICELAEEFRNIGTKDSYKVFQGLRAKPRIYSPVIIRGNEDLGVRLWGYGVTIFDFLVEKFENPEWGKLSDPKTGRDLTVWSIPKKSPGNDSDFPKPKVDVSPNQTQLLKKKADIVKIIEGMPDFLNDGETFPVRSYQELQDVVRELSDAEEGSEDDEPDDNSTTDVSYADSSSTDDDTSEDDANDELAAKLNDLLGDD